MIKKLAIACLLFGLFFLYLIPSSKAQAAGEFSTAYKVNYDLDQSGQTLVTQKITITNLTSRYFVSSFNLTIGSTTVSDVSATTDKGSLETKVESFNNKTSITVSLPQPITGEGKTQQFTLKFKSYDFAQTLGKIWEVNLPKIPSSQDISDYDLTLSVPSTFGEVSSMSPLPLDQSSSSSTLLFHYTQDQLLKSGVSINFGTNQLFDYNLKYHLDNAAIFPALTSLPIPPDTNYQDIIINKITPKPDNVTVDSDGNYLAWYKLAPKSFEDITIQGMAKLYIRPKNNLNTLSATDVAILTKPDLYWESDNPLIKQALGEIFKNSQPQTTQDKEKAIYRYVVDNLKYDTTRVDSQNLERLGAVTALNNPSSAVCMEFTDLFVALSRAAGIPSRELDGFAYSQNKQLRPLSLSKDLLHAWPEYFDPEKGWIMVDPTWENTSGGVDYFNKFDLNHLVLAIHGSSSISPNTSNQVKVELSQDEFVASSKLLATIDLPEQIWAGIPTQGQVRLDNVGNRLAPPLDFGLSTNKILVQGSRSLLVGPIPPYGNVIYKFTVKSPELFASYQDKLQVRFGDQLAVKPFFIQSFFAVKSAPYILEILLGIIGFGYLLTFATHFYRQYKKGKF